MIAIVVLAFVVGTLLGVLAGILAGRTSASRSLTAAVQAERARADAAVSAERDRAGEAVAAERRSAETAALQVAQLQARTTALQQSLDERAELLDETRRSLVNQFQAMSSAALEQNNKLFLDLASSAMQNQQQAAVADLDARKHAISELVSPVQETLRRMDENVRTVESARREAYGALTSQVRQLHEAQASLQTETRGLVHALRASGTRGRWGELQLRRVVELAGMVAHCDFTEQAATDVPGDRHRPDLVVHVPGGAKVVVDAKAPMDKFLEAQDCLEDDRRDELMRSHAKAVRSHIDSLGAKAYWSQFETTPEFVVLFLPGESLFATALEADPSLIEAAADRNVVVATPTTLIALLRAVAQGWRQERIAESAEEVRKLGVQLYERLRVLAGHFEDMRRSLQKSVDSYNKAVGSFDKRVLVTARKFEDLGATEGRERIPDLVTIDSGLRALAPPEDDATALPSVTPLAR